MYSRKNAQKSPERTENFSTLNCKLETLNTERGEGAASTALPLC